MKNIGRNDSCVCGSGKKYKKCCLNILSANTSKYRRQRQIQADVTRRLLEYATDNFGGPDLVREAWDTFNGVEDVRLPRPESPINLVFIPWVLFRCEFENADRAADPHLTIVEAFWLEHEDELTEEEISFLDAAAGAPFSLYEVLGVKPSISVRLRDLFTREESEVFGDWASPVLNKGMILYAAIMVLDEINSALAILPFPLPASAKQVVLELRKEITNSLNRDELTWMDVADLDSEIRSLYFGLALEVASPQGLLNSDDEAFLSQKVGFDLQSVDDSSNKLAARAGAGLRGKDIVGGAEM
jgi:SEC-C motif